MAVVTMTDIARARDALSTIPADRPRDDWLRTMMAARAAGLDYETVRDWSAQAESYSERDFETAWRSIKPNGGIGEATLFWIAHDYGWRESAQPRANGHAAPAAARPATRRKAPDVAALWIAGEPADGHPYLSARKIPPAGLRIVRGKLAVPYTTLDGELKTLQMIDAKGTKRSLANVHFDDAMYVIGTPGDDSTWYVVEGIGQGHAIARADYQACAAVSAGASRALTVARALRARWPRAPIVIATDAGQEEAAEKAAAAVGGEWLAWPAGSPKNYDAFDLERDKGTEALANWLTQDRQRPRREPAVRASQRKARRSSPAELDDAIEADRALAGALRLNRFTGWIDLVKPMPWPHDGKHWSDADVLQLQVYAERQLGMLASTRACSEAAHRAALRYRFDPLADYCAGLRWDGRPRIDTWLIDHCGADDSSYVRAVGRRWLVSGAARALEPGVKADCVLLLEGEQGRYKSTALRVLASDVWFSDSPLAFNDPRSVAEGLRGVWIHEISELASMRRAEIGHVKQTLAACEDRCRMAYAHEITIMPRRAIFGGTINPDATGTYLTDPTGARRFWPVCIAQCDIASLARERDQLWGEAVAAYRAGEHWWLEEPEQLEAARAETALRQIDNPWLDRTRRYLDEHPLELELRMGEIFEAATGRAMLTRETGSEGPAIAAALQALGFSTHRKNDGKVWRRKK